MLIIGSVNGRTSELKQIVQATGSPTLVAGNLGYRAAHEHYTDFRNRYKDFALFGNKDFYPYLWSDHSMGDYSTFPGFPETLCIRGGYTENWFQGIPGQIENFTQEPPATYWPEEQLRVQDFQNIIDKVEECPKVIVSFEPPEKIAEQMFGEPNRTRTGWGLQAVYENFQPEVWVFASKQENRVYYSDEQTKFISLGLLQTTEV